MRNEWWTKAILFVGGRGKWGDKFVVTHGPPAPVPIGDIPHYSPSPPPPFPHPPSPFQTLNRFKLLISLCHLQRQLHRLPHLSPSAARSGGKLLARGRRPAFGRKRSLGAAPLRGAAPTSPPWLSTTPTSSCAASWPASPSAGCAKNVRGRHTVSLSPPAACPSPF